MSKRKLGVSLLMAFAMMLVFSVAAMAAGVTTLKANVENGFVKATWTADADAAVTGYTVKLFDGTTELDSVTVTEAKYASTVTVTESKKYKIEVTTNGGANDTNKSSVEFWAPASNKEITSTDKDNNLGNANQTGTGVTTNDGSKNTNVIKSTGMVKNDGSTGTHRTHGEYQNNTNSCASCHQTHTGASKSLLFKDGVYNTCTACHDGTLGFYNVFEHSNAGTFGGTAEGNMSIHLADGSVQAKAAPGGNLSANSGKWVNEFNCASCHSPHGSYSDRLLHYNPNGMGLATKAEGGIGLKGEAVVNFADLPAAAAGLTKLVRGTATELGVTELTGTETVIAIMDSWDDPATTAKTFVWKRNTTPWLYGYAHATPKNYYTRFYKDFGSDADGQMKIVDDGHGGKDYAYVADFHDNELGNSTIVFNKGYIYTTTTFLNDVKTADVGRAYTVDLDLEEIAKFGDANGVPIYQSNVNSLYDGTKAGAGVQMSTYCASCHTDYLAKSGSATGTFNTAYRHTTTSDSYTCVRCHYAHGTDVTVMMDAEGHKVGDTLDDKGTPETTDDIIATTDYMLDQNPSSALKRYTNMSVCWGCHTDSKAEQLKNTNSYGDDNDPHGLGDQPAMPGKIKQGAVDNGSMFKPDGSQPLDPSIVTP
jgi:predicted CXXCH cytochrome family protein